MQKKNKNLPAYLYIRPATLKLLYFLKQRLRDKDEILQFLFSKTVKSKVKSFRIVDLDPYILYFL